jgi:hypothetical protein
MVWFLGSLDYKYGLVAPDEFVARGWLTPVFSDTLGVVYALSAPASELLAGRVLLGQLA